MMVKSVIVAAGEGRRFGSKKQFEKIHGKMVFQYSLKLLERFGDVVLVVSAEDVEFVKRLHGDILVVEGGKERMHSVFNGISAIDSCDVVLIHDAARPVIDEELVERVIESASEFGTAIPAVPAFETLKMAEDGFAFETIDRSRIVISQTPQGFDFGKLKDILAMVLKKGEVYTDEAAVWERFVGRVKIVEGSRKNIKITTKDDLEIVRCLLG